MNESDTLSSAGSASELTFWSYLNFLIILVVTIITILGNLLVILVYATNKQIRTPANLYICSLAVVDFIVGVFILPADAVLVMRGVLTRVEFWCKFRLIFAIFLEYLSILHLIAIAFDRHRAIFDGIGYIRRRTILSVLVKLGYIWILGIWMVSSPLIDWNDNDLWFGMDEGYCLYKNTVKWTTHYTIGAFYLPTSIMILLYFKIFRRIRKMLAKKRRTAPEPGTQHTTSDVEDSGAITDDSDCGNPPRHNVIHEVNEKKEKECLRKERKATKTLGGLIGAFLVLVTPIFVCTTFSALFFQVHRDILSFAAFMVHANSCVNPLIYASCSLEFREAFKKRLLFWKRT